MREIYRMIDESRALTEGGAPHPYPPMSYEANRRGIAMAIDWAFEQKIIPRRLKVEELFDDTTIALN